MAKLIGTAGHVDHGKTSLIRALTGIDADRLPEEKSRGMTIDIGFAFLDLPEVGRVSIVDVPGHEKFLTNMLVGALGIDVALLCVASDESVKPQTVEHLQILDLLPVDRLVVALTRADLADEDLRAITQGEVEELLDGSRFTGSPQVFVSATTGEGLEDLRKELIAALISPESEREGLWYLPIDRVFTVKGHGTVVTGTLARGTVTEGQAAVIMPGRREVRVRAIKTHDLPIERAEPGMRVALNLGGIKHEELHRGLAVGAPGALFETRILDAQVKRVGPLKYGMRVRVSLGAEEGIAKAFFSDEQPDIVQLRLERSVAVAMGQSLIIRRYSPPDLLAGGIVVVPQAKTRRKSEAPVVVGLASDDSQAIVDLVERHPAGLATEEICRVLGKSPQSVGDTFERLKNEGQLLGFAGLWLTPQGLADSTRKLQASLQDLHSSSPTVGAWPRERAISGAGLPWTGKPLDRILAHLGATGQLKVQGSDIALADFVVSLTGRQSELLERVCLILDEAGVNVPGDKDIARILGIPLPAVTEMIRLGLAAGKLVRIDQEIYYTDGGLARIKQKVAEIGAGGRSFPASEVRDRLQTSRKYVIPLLEYLDTIRFTLRQGENRVIQ